MADLKKTIPEESLLDRVMEFLVSVIVVFFLIIWTAAAFLDTYSNFTQGRVNDWSSNDLVFLLSGVLSLCVGLSIVFPKVVGVKLKKLLSKMFRPLVIIKDFLSSKIIQYKLGDKINYLLNNNRFFQAGFCFLLSMFWIFFALLAQSLDGLFSQIASIFFYCLSFFCIITGFGFLLPRTMMLIGKGILFLLLVVSVAVGAVFIYKGIAILPISVAIIIGAIIIASAVKRS